MGHSVKLQKISRKTTDSYYVNFPSAFAEAMQVDKGELFEWFIEDKNTLILVRKNKSKKLEFRNLDH
jgi:bifunctional DNA-binding transcriptional regulator/antitoxin component of YhaV-PrlF toxin-antitoxin module